MTKNNVRFKKMDTIIDPFPIWDTVEEKGYNCTDTLDLLVNLLNEQQAIISALREENEQLQKQVKSSETTSNATSHYNAFLESKITTLEKENEQLKSRIAFFEEQEDEFEKYTAQTIQNMIADYREG